MELSSPAFEHFGAIPDRYGCDGDNINPPLDIADVSQDTASLALVMEDPDAPNGPFIHWLVWNIDPRISTIEEANPPEQAIEGINSAEQVGYTGPCPPSGEHHYIFRLYALDKVLELSPDSSYDGLLDAINEHVIEETELVGLFKKREL